MNLSFLQKIKGVERNTILGVIAIIAIIVVAVLVSANQGGGLSLQGILGMPDQQIGEKVINYINENQLSEQPAELVSVAEESGLVKVTIKIGDQQFESYATKDGKILFPSRGLDMEPKSAGSSANSSGSTQTQVPVTKTASPTLEAFVVSDCPYGLQMQRALAEAVKNVPSLASNIVVRYIGFVTNGQINSMHDTDSSGKAVSNGPEAKENLKQICIREEQPSKYWNYVSCYMQKSSGTLPNGMPLGDSAGCLIYTGVDAAKLNACVSDPSRGIADAQKDFALDDKYNITGSPTLILNGTQISESGFGGRSSDGVKSMVCAGFNTEPSFCSTQLDTIAAAASFSATYASASGVANSAANCATAQ